MRTSAGRAYHASGQRSSRTRSAADDVAPVDPGLLQRGLHAPERLPGHERADQRARLARVADRDARVGGRETVDERIDHGLVHDQPPQARAALPCRADGGEQDAAHDEVEVGARRDDRGVVAAELEQRAPEPRGDARRERPPHLRRAGRRDERHARVVGELHGTVGAADHELEEPVRDVAEARRRPVEERRAREGAERRSLRGLPDHGVAADERDRGVPAPHGDREVEGADHGDGAERVPGLGQPVAGALRRDRAAVELAREPDREVADVDHLLHLAEALLGDLPDLERDERAERLLLAAQLLAEQAHELASTGRGDVPPRLERVGCAAPPQRPCRPHRFAPPARSPRR